jgi:hypothetical protein
MTIANMMEDRAALTAQMDAVPTSCVRMDVDVGQPKIISESVLH